MSRLELGVVGCVGMLSGVSEFPDPLRTVLDKSRSYGLWVRRIGRSWDSDSLVPISVPLSLPLPSHKRIVPEDSGKSSILFLFVFLIKSTDTQFGTNVVSILGRFMVYSTFVVR